jgi:citrate lyase subunit beta-like protein
MRTPQVFAQFQKMHTSSSLLSRCRKNSQETKRKQNDWQRTLHSVMFAKSLMVPRNASSKVYRFAVRPLSTQQNLSLEERPRRALFSCPGADPRKIAKAQTLGADAVVLDLEDGVALEKKDDARALVKETLLDHDTSFGKSELCVRINALDTREMALRDLEAILPCERLDAIVIPKVEKASDIDFVSQMMDSVSPTNRDVRIIAAVESALGMLNLREIAATQGRLDALVFASEDYCADLEAIRTPSALELLYARSQLVTTAKAYGLQAIDMVHIRFRDLEDLAEECQRGRELGFTGKQAIHPMQVETIHEAFSPSIKDVDFASRVVEKYMKTTAAGNGACVVDGIVVDFPVYKWAMKVLKRAESSGMI